MRKTKTVNGDPAYRIKLETIFTRGDFARALAEESYNGPTLPMKTDFSKLTKLAAKKILLSRLAWNGRRGEFQGLDNLGEYTDLLNAEYEKAYEWIDKNYPYLKAAQK